MTRGVTKDSLVNAVLQGLGDLQSPAMEGVAELKVAQSLIATAQPCRVHLALTQVEPASRKRPPKVRRDVKVIGLRGTTRAIVSVLPDSKPSSLKAGLVELQAGTRRRSEVPAYQMLALTLEAPDEERIARQLQAIREAAQGTQTRHQIDVYTGEPKSDTGITRVPVAVVLKRATPAHA